MHITFSTKDRYPFIKDEIQNELYAYLSGICKNLESYPLKIGGFKDHVHILCLLSRKVALMKLVEELKSHSSKWIKTKGRAFEKFYWQNGYGGFSIGPREVDTVTDYIVNQESHHRKVSFKQEYLMFLKNYDVPYDDRYVWD